MRRQTAPKRAAFRHGNLSEALLEAALRHIEAHGADSITMRDLAHDTGVNHRAIYRYFPDKETLLADAAERCWQEYIARLRRATSNTPPGEPTLVAAGIAMYHYGRDNPNHFLFATGAYPGLEAKFPKLEAAIMATLQIFAIGFAGTGMAPDIVVSRAAVYTATLQGIVSQILHRRLRLAPAHATEWMTGVCAMLVKGFK
jgi:AcrR family transcriptional regulator